jgi:hypothetical protein
MRMSSTMFANRTAISRRSNSMSWRVRLVGNAPSLEWPSPSNSDMIVYSINSGLSAWPSLGLDGPEARAEVLRSDGDPGLGETASLPARGVAHAGAGGLRGSVVLG